MVLMWNEIESFERCIGCTLCQTWWGRAFSEEEEEAKAKKDKDCAFPDCILGGLVGSIGVRSLGLGGMGTDVPSLFEVCLCYCVAGTLYELLDFW